MPDTASAKSQQRGLIPFKPGQSGNPAGRAKGSRNKLGEAFIEALHDDFAVHGKQAIIDVRTDKPDQYLKVIASLMPKDINLNLSNDAEDWTDDEIRERIRDLAGQLAPFLGGAGSAEGYTGTTGGPAPLCH